jgi:hypothetical protein
LFVAFFCLSFFCPIFHPSTLSSVPGWRFSPLGGR